MDAAVDTALVGAAMHLHCSAQLTLLRLLVTLLYMPTLLFLLLCIARRQS
jgi:hypothetical protein